ncbi:MAG: peptidylprolyl isomerase [Planctomycetota bacterium]
MKTRQGKRTVGPCALGAEGNAEWVLPFCKVNLSVVFLVGFAYFFGGHAEAWQQPPVAAQTGSNTTGAATLTPRVKIETSLGDFVVRLDADKAPLTVTNFVQYVDEKFYDGTIFHRVVSGFVIQGGAMTPDLQEKQSGLHPAIKNEWKNGWKNERGTVAMARLGNQPDSAKASFFINQGDNEVNDRPIDGAAYTVFGAVIEGMDVVDRIAATPVTTDKRLREAVDRAVVPVEPVVIKSVRLLDVLDREKTALALKEFDSRRKAAEDKRKQDANTQIQVRIKKLEDEHKAKFTTTSSGLMYMDTVKGQGGAPSANNLVVVHYRGTFADGEEFDNSRTNEELEGQPLEAPVSKMVPGWQEGILSMQIGGKRLMVIPPNLAFGDKGRPGVPPKATLFYEIELIGIK